MKKATLSALVCLFLAAIYAIIFANVDLLSNVNFADILDRRNYIYYAEAPLDILDVHLQKSILSAIFNEPGFLFINWIVGSVAGDAVATVRALIFFSASVGGYFAFRKARNFLIAFAILLVPFVFANYVLSLRQGVALAFFLIGWYCANRRYKILFMGFAPFVHISFLVPLTFISILYFSKKIKISGYYNMALFSIVCLFLISLAQYVGSYLQIRQTEGYYSEFGADSIATGLGLFFWVGLLAIFLTAGRQFVESNMFSIYCIVFYIICYIIFPPFSRTMQNHALIVLVAGSALRGGSRTAFNLSIGAVFVFTCIGIVERGFLYSFYA